MLIVQKLTFAIFWREISLQIELMLELKGYEALLSVFLFEKDALRKL